MMVSAVLDLLRSRSFFDKRVTKEMVQAYLEAIIQGDVEASCVATISRRHDLSGINYIHFSAMLHWIAGMREITFAECISKLLNCRDNINGKLRILFHRFGSAKARKLMSTKDFKHFCERMGIFIPGRFSPGDIHLMFMKNATLFQKFGTDGYKLCTQERLMDASGFMRSIKKVAERMKVCWKAFSRFLVLRAESLGLILK